MKKFSSKSSSCWKVTLPRRPKVKNSKTYQCTGLSGCNTRIHRSNGSQRSWASGSLPRCDSFRFIWSFPWTQTTSQAGYTQLNWLQGLKKNQQLKRKKVLKKTVARGFFCCCLHDQMFTSFSWACFYRGLAPPPVLHFSAFRTELHQLWVNVWLQKKKVR